ncbi:uncharacterized protein DUF4276 [Mucilaginibacter oryzae]|uniref:Uncharacterized protein DUF4276 n=1 Tax=Mucilaginibacter oryzae TaxID=468058 RepID=A0A316GYI6_9SPHI|nr:DUF4276 family protein [Mucilaginibacter oryzae]PWK69983.1 uncharacterized protein DUF4276 [Mucilaginibacter oryzae]
MKRIIIVCEGQTEQEFCKDVLQPHFNKKEIYLQSPTIKKSGGGIVPWKTLKGQIENHLKQDKEAFVTTFLDYYGIHDNHAFPEWDACKRIIHRDERMDLLKTSMHLTIDVSISHRFIPYLQLHEFEGLLFNDIKIFEDNFRPDELVNKPELEQTINANPNPELINDTPQNAPSYRLARIINGYNKIVYGSILAESIGLEKIRAKSPRFNNWITKLENL